MLHPACHSVERNTPFHKQSKCEIPTPFGFPLPQRRIIRALGTFQLYLHSFGHLETPSQPHRACHSPPRIAGISQILDTPPALPSPALFPSSLGCIPPTRFPELFHPSSWALPVPTTLSQFEKQDVNESNKYPMWIPYPQQQMGTEQRSLSLIVTYGNTHCATVTPFTRLPGQEHSQFTPKDSLI